MNGSYPEYDAVIILAHSMGGLIATDAFRKLASLSRKVDDSILSEKKTLTLAAADVDPKDFQIEFTAVMSDNTALGINDENNLGINDGTNLGINDGSNLGITDENNLGITDENNLGINNGKNLGINDTTDITNDIINAKVPSSSGSKNEHSSWLYYASNWWKRPITEESSDKSPIVNDTDDLKSFPVDTSEPLPIHEKITTGQLETMDLKTTKVNIISIICFDSPFYGLHSTVFTKGVGDYSADLISSYAPSRHAETLKSTIKKGNQIAVQAATSLPQATSTALSTLFLPFSNPKKAAGMVLTPIKAAPYAIALAATSVSSTIKGAVSTVFSTNTGAASAVPSNNTDESSAITLNPADESSTVSSTSTNESSSNSTEVVSCSFVDFDEENNVSVVQSYIKKSNIQKSSSREKNSGDNDQTDSNLNDNELVDPTPSRAELLPIPKDTDWSSWITLGITTAALGAGYYSGGLLAVGAVSSLARGAALAYAVPAAESGRQHLQFLYPIWGENQKACQARINALEQAKETCFVRIYFLDVSHNDDESRTFIKPPPPKTSHMFQKVGSDLDNEIAAHMLMFSREDNPGAYWDLIHRAGKDIKNVITKHRDKKSLIP